MSLELSSSGLRRVVEWRDDAVLSMRKALVDVE